MTVRVLTGDCLDLLRAMPAESVHTCVTSPPYFNLRDYQMPGQIGLEKSPEEFVEKLVEVFREVRRVLRNDGTVFLNLGDSYAGTGKSGGGSQGQRWETAGADTIGPRGGKWSPAPRGFKQKDMLGIPWSVAKALQAPYYTGRIKDERDRIWLAAMIDAEGCMFIHKRKAGTDSGARFTRADGTEVSYARTQDTYGAGLEIANTHLSIVERCAQITGVGSICRHEKDRRQPLYRWNVRSNECRWIIEEVYPYLVGKQHQARLLLGCPSSGKQAEAAHAGLIALHNGSPTDVNFAAPAPLFQPGYYLRQDIIWSKSNPMPESVTDRCTKAHEYIFLLSKGPRYYYDHEAIKVPVSASFANDPRHETGSTDANEKDGYEAAGAQNPKGPHRLFRGSGNKERKPRPGAPSSHRGRQSGSIPWEPKMPVVDEEGRKALRTDTESRHRSSIPGGQSPKANRRSVWTVTTKPFKGAHFATFPPDLIEPCILAGSPRGGTVLDPFGGAGTTGLVAAQHQRHAILCELNPAYADMARERIAREAGLFAWSEAAE